MRRLLNVRRVLLVLLAAGGATIGLRPAPLAAQVPAPQRTPPQVRDALAQHLNQERAVAEAQDEAAALAAGGRLVPDRYLVVLKREVASPDAASKELAGRHGLTVRHVYGSALKGFSAAMAPDRLVALKNDPRVAFIEQEQVFEAQGKLEALGKPDGQDGPEARASSDGGGFTTAAQSIPWGVRKIGAHQSVFAAIDGVDQRVPVNVAVIDTGVQPNHPDLYVLGGFNATSPNTAAWGDGHGHGTHVAGTIAALDNGVGVVGVAPGAGLYAVKVLNDQGSGTTSWVVAGIDWVAANAAARDITVANMSLGGGHSTAILEAMNNAVGHGVTFCVAAGNSGVDCAGSSPANSTNPGVLTVSAQAPDGWLAGFSNFGRNEPFGGEVAHNGVDVIAPGVSIYSTYKGGGYATMSGTSMASPHVAGTAALFVALYRDLYNNARPVPWEVRDAVMTSAPPGSIGVYYFWNVPYYYGIGSWRAANGDTDAGYPVNADHRAYEPLVNAGRY